MKAEPRLNGAGTHSASSEPIHRPKPCWYNESPLSMTVSPSRRTRLSSEPGGPEPTRSSSEPRSTGPRATARAARLGACETSAPLGASTTAMRISLIVDRTIGAVLSSTP